MTETKKALINLKEAIDTDQQKAINKNDLANFERLEKAREHLSKISPIF